MSYDLDFERPLLDLDRRIQSLLKKGERLRQDEHTRLADLRQQLEERTRQIYDGLTPAERVQVARHKNPLYRRLHQADL
jgi:acetyl-CoA carboxylase carboxyl transferase subunit alpha